MCALNSKDCQFSIGNYAYIIEKPYMLTTKITPDSSYYKFFKLLSDKLVFKLDISQKSGGGSKLLKNVIFAKIVILMYLYVWNNETKLN